MAMNSAPCDQNNIKHPARRLLQVQSQLAAQPKQIMYCEAIVNISGGIFTDEEKACHEQEMRLALLEPIPVADEDDPSDVRPPYDPKNEPEWSKAGAWIEEKDSQGRVVWHNRFINFSRFSEPWVVRVQKEKSSASQQQTNNNPYDLSIEQPRQDQTGASSIPGGPRDPGSQSKEQALLEPSPTTFDSVEEPLSKKGQISMNNTKAEGPIIDVSSAQTLELKGSLPIVRPSDTSIDLISEERAASEESMRLALLVQLPDESLDDFADESLPNPERSTHK